MQALLNFHGKLLQWTRVEAYHNAVQTNQWSSQYLSKNRQKMKINRAFRDRPEVSSLILNEFKRINILLLPLKLSPDSTDFRENRSFLIFSNSLNITGEIFFISSCKLRELLMHEVYLSFFKKHHEKFTKATKALKRYFEIL